MDLRTTNVKNIYKKYNPEKPKEDNSFPGGIYYPPQKYFVWNNYKREMILLEVEPLYSDININSHNEYLQSAKQGYEFTIIDHIYEKNNKNYKYNNITLKFDEIKLDIKCQRN